MELIAAATLYGLFSMWLLFLHLRVPQTLTRAAAVLGWLEFVAIVGWGFATEECVRAPCPFADTAGTAAAYDLPVLSVVLLGLAVAQAVRRRRQATVRSRPARLAE